MKIIRLKTAVVEGNFDWTFVHIETDETITGLGKCFLPLASPSFYVHSNRPFLARTRATFIVRFANFGLPQSGAGSTGGIIYNAISGIETALSFHGSDVPFWNDFVDGLPKPMIQDGFMREVE